MALDVHLEVVKRRAAVRAAAVIWLQRAAHGTVPRAVPMAHILLSLLHQSIPTNAHTLLLQLPFGNKLGNDADQRKDHCLEELGLGKSAQLVTFTRIVPSFSFPSCALSPVTGSWLLSKYGKMQKCPAFTTGRAVLG